MTHPRWWAIPGALLLTCVPAVADESALVYAQGSLAKARDACKNVKFVSPKVKLVFGPQLAQNPNIETVVLKVERNGQGKPIKIVIHLVIAGTDPPVPTPYHALVPDETDFKELVARLLLEKK
jgi:hypothetical protein